jgi:hypothetical protein
VALVLDGRALAKQIEADLLVRVEALKAKTGVPQFWQQFWLVMMVHRQRMCV